MAHNSACICRIPALLYLAVLFGVSNHASARNYYVRTDGGTPQQCTGVADKPYRSGIRQPCAWAHPFFALATLHRWKIAAGDTLLIGSGSYRMDGAIPHFTLCNGVVSRDCHLPPLPSGLGPDQPTRLAGRQFGSGCSAKPELWGAGGAFDVVELTGSSNVAVECLEITDHAGCSVRHVRVPCSARDDWASNGIAAFGAENITLRNLLVHGLAEYGILAGRFHNLNVENVTISGNGRGGWNFDIGGNDHSNNTGDLHFSRLMVEWNGCVEGYPERIPAQCWGQHNGGFGDGLGEARTGGSWYFADSVFRYNTQDGLDLLYHTPQATTRIERVRAYGNAGNQVKIAGHAIIMNSVIVGSCAHFAGRPFSILEPQDICRANGDALALVPFAAMRLAVYNSTIVGEGGVLLSMSCHGQNCQASPASVEVRNNIFRGYPSRITPGKRPGSIWVGGKGVEIHADHNLFFGVKAAAAHFWACGVGSDYRCEDPEFVRDGLESFDLSLRPGSPALSRGVPLPAVRNDINRIPRPDTGAYDLGACQLIRASIPGGPSACSWPNREPVGALSSHQ